MANPLIRDLNLNNMLLLMVQMDIKQLYQMLTQSKNPMQVFTTIAQNNPKMQPILNLLQNGYSP